MEYRVCYADTDAAGIVYHGKYIEMAERSRAELVHAAGFPPELLSSLKGTGFIVRSIVARHLRFAVLDDVLRIESRIVDMDPARSWWLTEIMREEDDICAVLVEVAYYDRAKDNVILLDEAVVSAFESHGLVTIDPSVQERFRRYLSWLCH
jgi:YbgC/YbaW family acyl-CoA thioester hydrolase